MGAHEHQFCGGTSGMVSNRERHHGKMEYLGPIAQSHQTQIGHTSFKPRIRLEPTTTSLPLSCIELLVVLGVSILHKGPSYQSHILNLMENLHCLLLIGTRLISRFVCDILPPFLQYFVTQKKSSIYLLQNHINMWLKLCTISFRMVIALSCLGKEHKIVVTSQLQRQFTFGFIIEIPRINNPCIFWTSSAGLL